MPESDHGSNQQMVRPIPEGYHTVTPWIISRNTAGLIEFVKTAFAAQDLGRVTLEDGSIGHAEVRIGDSVVMMFDAKPHWPDTPAFLRLYVPDAEGTFQRALQARATAVTELTHLFWGDLVGRVGDPFGNLWWIQQRIEEVSPEEMERRMSDPVFSEALAYVQGAEFFPPEKLRSKQ